MANKTALFKTGEVFRHEMLVTPGMMRTFHELSGDGNPVHADPEYARAHGFREPIVYGNMLGLMISHVVGMKLPTPEVVILSETLQFHKPNYVGERIVLEATVANIHEAVGSVVLKLAFFGVAGEKVCTGQCVIKCL